MGKQIDYYIMPEELRCFALKVIDEMNAIVLSPQSKTSKPKVLASAFKSNSDDLPLTVMLARPDDLESIKPEMIRKDLWSINAGSNLVIEFGRCYMDETLIRGGAGIFYEYRYFENGIYHDKPDDFIKWVEKIFRLLRKELVKVETDYGSTEYVGRQTLAWLKSLEKPFKIRGDLIYSY